MARGARAERATRFATSRYQYYKYEVTIMLTVLQPVSRCMREWLKTNCTWLWRMQWVDATRAVSRGERSTYMENSKLRASDLQTSKTECANNLKDQ